MEFLRKFFEGREKESKNIVVVVFIIGMLLIMLGGNVVGRSKNNENEVEEEPLLEIKNTKVSDTYEESLENRLEEILKEVDGAGNVKVMVTLSKNQGVVVGKNLNESSDKTAESDSAGGIRDSLSTSKEEDVVIITDESGIQKPLILYETLPEIEGVLVAAQGGGDVHIKEMLTHSVMAVVNVSANKVCIVKMK